MADLVKLSLRFKVGELRKELARYKRKELIARRALKEMKDCNKCNATWFSIKAEITIQEMEEQ